MGEPAILAPDLEAPTRDDIEAAIERRACAFIEARKDLQLEVALGRKILEVYAAQVTLVLQRITALFERTQAALRDGRAPDATIIADARLLVNTSDELEAAAHDWMDIHVRPIIDRHRTIAAPADANQALVQGWGDSFYRLVRVEYDHVTDCLDACDEANDRIHDLRSAIARCVIREVDVGWTLLEKTAA